MYNASRVKDISLASWGRKELDLAVTEMPGLIAINKEFGQAVSSRAPASQDPSRPQSSLKPSTPSEPQSDGAHATSSPPRTTLPLPLPRMEPPGRLSRNTGTWPDLGERRDPTRLSMTEVMPPSSASRALPLRRPFL
jgi:hypothetical protein